MNETSFDTFHRSDCEYGFRKTSTETGCKNVRIMRACVLLPTKVLPAEMFPLSSLSMLAKTSKPVKRMADFGIEPMSKTESPRYKPNMPFSLIVTVAQLMIPVYFGY